MILDEYFAEIQNTVDPRKAMALGIDENLQIAFQNQIVQLNSLLSSLKDVKKLEEYYKYGKSQCVIDIRQTFGIYDSQAVINPEKFDSVVNFFHAHPRTDYDSGVMDMRTIALECINYSLQNSLPTIVYYNSPTGAIFIPSSRNLLRV